jgi:RNA polymerase sigma-70 factor, ECF subfamily
MIEGKNDVILQIIKGDKNAFEKTFYEFFPRLYRFSYDYVKDRDIAREISHETLIKLWESRNTLNSDTNLDGLLFTICRNQCLNYLKHQKVMLKYRDIKNSELNELEFQTNMLQDYNFNAMDLKNLEKKIQDAIGNLPEQCRSVFELSRFGNKKYAEIAAHLNIAQKTVEAHMSQALRRLREDLKDFL